MAGKLDPIRRLRAALGLNQEPFGDLFGVGQSTVSEWERGAPLPSEKALRVWEQHGARLRRIGVKLEDLLRSRNGYKPRRRAPIRGKRARKRDAGNGAAA